MLSSFRKDKIAACAVYALSDKLFKGPIEIFSKTYTKTIKHEKKLILFVVRPAAYRLCLCPTKTKSKNSDKAA